MFLNLNDATYTEARYLCSNCWGDLLNLRIGPNSYDVRCKTEGCPCHGYVSKRHVEMIEAKAHAELIRVRINLRKYVDWIPYEPLTNEQILNKLGF